MFSIQDKQVLRQLAQRVHDIAQLPQQQFKRDMWRRHTALKHGIPPVFVSPEGSWVELLPPETLQCENAFARQVELELRRRIYRHEHIPDDTPVEDHYDIPVADIGFDIPWGIVAQRRPSSTRGAWHHIPVIEEPEDWKKLKKPSLRIYEDEARRNAEARRRNHHDAGVDRQQDRGDAEERQRPVHQLGRHVRAARRRARAHDEAEVAALAERVRACMERANEAGDKPWQIHTSVGYAELHGGHEGVRPAIAAADEMLYRDKQTRR